jgi:hypothetical protein
MSFGSNLLPSSGVKLRAAWSILVKMQRVLVNAADIADVGYSHCQNYKAVLLSLTREHLA